MVLYPKLPKLDSADFEWETHPVPPPATSDDPHKQIPGQNAGHSNKKRHLRRPPIAPLRPLTLRATAIFVGLCLHLLHLCLRMHRMQIRPECNCSWEDFPSLDSDGAWIDWVCHQTTHCTIINLAWCRQTSGA